MNELLTLTEAEIASGISRDMWRKLARDKHVTHTRAGGLAQILIPLNEVARVVASGWRPRRGRPRLTATELIPDVPPQLEEERTSPTQFCITPNSGESRNHTRLYLVQRRAAEDWKRNAQADPEKYLSASHHSLHTATELYQDFLHAVPSTRLDLSGFTKLIPDWEVHCREPIGTCHGSKRLYATHRRRYYRARRPWEIAAAYNRERAQDPPPQQLESVEPSPESVAL